MKNNFYILSLASILFVLISCSESSSSRNNLGSPSREFQEFTITLDELNQVSDSARLVEKGLYNELDLTQITQYNKHPFYPISYSSTHLRHIANIEHFKNLDTLLFKKAQHIWGYFYREKDATGMISDGVIEEWTFAKKEDAQTALEQFTAVGDIVYFNTRPYFCRIQNRLYVFHTRAMAFSIDQKLVFDSFVNLHKISI